MEPISKLTKPGMMARLRNRKGFSLVEMAIVLVIIGLIIGAIIKGQDLITNSQAKKAIAAVSSWRNLTVAFMDRNGRFPGDEGKDGIIGNNNGGAGSETTVDLDAIGELVPVMQNVPENPIVIGSSSFWVYIGSLPTTNSGTRNAILVCGSVACTVPFTTDQLEIIKSMDTAFDGEADGGAGQFRAVTAAVTLVPAAPAVATGSTKMSATFNGTAPVVPVINTTVAGVAPWTAGVNLGAVWLFDKPF